MAKFNLESNILNNFERYFCDNISKQLGDHTLNLIKEEYDNSTDPYGDVWKKRKDNDPHPLLIDTGAFYNDWQLTIKSNGFEVSNSTPYASYLQEGTEKMPARKTVPNKQLPTKWKEDYLKLIHLAIQDIK